MSIINYFNESEIMNQHRYGNGTDTNHKWPAAKNCVWWWCMAVLCKSRRKQINKLAHFKFSTYVMNSIKKSNFALRFTLKSLGRCIYDFS